MQNQQTRRKIKWLLSLFIVIIIGLGTIEIVKSIYYDVFQTTKRITVGKLQEGQKVKEMDTLIENYNCYKFTDIENGILTYCERKKQLPIEFGQAQVRGYFVRASTTIWIDKNQSNDTVLHELFHWADIHFAGKDSETRAYAFQEMYTQLVNKKIIK